MRVKYATTALCAGVIGLAGMSPVIAEEQASDSGSGSSQGSGSSGSDTSGSGYSDSGSSGSGSGSDSSQAQSGASGQKMSAAQGMELVGQTIQGAEGEELGEVSNVIANQKGEVAAVIMDSGGILGLGGSSWRVGWDRIQVEQGAAKGGGETGGTGSGESGGSGQSAERGQVLSIGLTSDQVEKQLQRYEGQEGGGQSGSASSGSGSSSGESGSSSQ